MRREICAVVTKGTLTDGELLSSNPEASYLMALTEHHQNKANGSLERIYGVCLVDVATSRVLLGQVSPFTILFYGMIYCNMNLFLGWDPLNVIKV